MIYLLIFGICIIIAFWVDHTKRQYKRLEDIIYSDGYKGRSKEIEDPNEQREDNDFFYEFDVHGKPHIISKQSTPEQTDIFSIIRQQGENARNELFQQFIKIKDILKKESPFNQIITGHSINQAHSVFAKHYPTPAHFLEEPSETRFKMAEAICNLSSRKCVTSSCITI